MWSQSSTWVHSPNVLHLMYFIQFFLARISLHHSFNHLDIFGCRVEIMEPPLYHIFHFLVSLLLSSAQAFPQHFSNILNTASFLRREIQVSQRYSKQEKLPYFNKWGFQTRRRENNSHPRRSLSKKFCHSFCLHERADTLATMRSRTVMDGTRVPAIHCIALANYLPEALLKVNQYVLVMNKMNSEYILRPTDDLLRL